MQLAAKLLGHGGTAFSKLTLAHGYVWSESSDGSHLLWQPFVSILCFFLLSLTHFSPTSSLLSKTETKTWQYLGEMGGGCVSNKDVVDVGDGTVWVSCSHERKQCLHLWRVRNRFMLF